MNNNIKSKENDSSKIIIKVEDNSLGFLENETSVNLSGIVDTVAAGQLFENGESVEEQQAVTPNSEVNTHTPSTDNVSAIIEYRYYDSLGGSEGQKRAQISMKEQFEALVGDSYYKIDVSECDLLVLQALCVGACQVVCELDRLLYSYAYFDKINVAAGKNITFALGGDWANISANKKAYVDLRNQLASLINEKFYVGHTKAIDKSLYLCSRIFAEDVNRKTTYIIFTPEEYTAIVDGTARSYGLFNQLNQLGTRKNFTLTNLQAFLDSLNDFAISAWYSEVSPYLFHLYGVSKDGLFKLSPYSESAALGLIYNDNVLEMIRNMDLVGTPRGTDVYLSDEGNTHRIDIYEDRNGHICQGGALDADSLRCDAPLLNPIACVHEAADLAAYGCIPKTYQGNRVINLSDYPFKTSALLSVLEGKVITTDVKWVSPTSDTVRESVKGKMLKWTSSQVFMSCNRYEISSEGLTTRKAFPVFLGIRATSSSSNFDYDTTTTALLPSGTGANMRNFMIQNVLIPNTALPQRRIILVQAPYGISSTSFPVYKDVDNRFTLSEVLIKNYLYAICYDAHHITIKASRNNK